MTTEMIALPGMANAHSHAFQRLLRGSVQRRTMGREDTFWTWRESMYDLACRLDLQGLEAASRLCFVECLEAGYTAVGEFHYLHHQPDGAAYDDPVATSRAVVRAASQAGIRLCLLWTVYARGGFDAPLQSRQRRFGVTDLDAVRRSLDALSNDLGGDMCRMGLAIHSVRAVPHRDKGRRAAIGAFQFVAMDIGGRPVAHSNRNQSILQTAIANDHRDSPLVTNADTGHLVFV